MYPRDRALPKGKGKKQIPQEITGREREQILIMKSKSSAYESVYLRRLEF